MKNCYFIIYESFSSSFDNWSRVRDVYVPFEKEKEFADMIADSQIVISDGGHLNAESGYCEFSDLLKYVEQKIRIVQLS